MLSEVASCNIYIYNLYTKYNSCQQIVWYGMSCHHSDGPSADFGGQPKFVWTQCICTKKLLLSCCQEYQADTC